MSTTPTEEQVGTRDGGREIPMVQAAPVVGSMIDFARDTIGAVVGGWQTEGDLFYVKVPMKLAIAVHPDHIKHVLEDHHDDYEPVPWVSAAWNKTVGNGLLASGGHHWARQRRIEQPAFEKDRIARFAETMTAVATESADRWAPAAERGEPIDLKDEMTRLTLEVLARCLFGANWEREAAQIPPAISVCLEYMFAQLKTPVSVPLSVPTPSNRRFLKARQELDDVVHRLIADRRREPGEDIISLMLTSKDSETGESMSDEDIRDEVMALVFAGHETVSVGMTWAWYLLATNPPAQRRLQAEVDEALGGRLPTNDDIPNLPWTWMVLQEALRLYAPVWPIARQPIKDVEISGFHVPKGTMVMILPYLTHRHPDFWENPEGFDPERFSPERSEGRSHFAFIPFGTGPRACLGWPFARLQLRLVTATLAQRYEFRLPPRGKPALPQPGITLRPAEPILAEVVRRGG